MWYAALGLDGAEEPMAQVWTLITLIIGCNSWKETERKGD
jgi:hypothetical protein